MLTVWGRANSSNVMKVLWLCEEAGIPFTRIDAGGAFGRTREPGYLAMNPNATVPTIVEDDGFSLWESNSILRYLAGPLHPAEPRARARAEQWMDWSLGHLNGSMVTVFFTYIRTPEAERNWPATHAARDAAEKLWAMVDAALEGQEGPGGAFGLADIALGPWLHRWLNLPIERAAMPRLEAWYHRLLARPGFARHVAVELK